MTGWESPSHWLIIALVVLVLFGYKRLPEMSRSLGRSLRIFKTEIKGMGQDDAARESAETLAPSAPPVASAPVASAPPVVSAPPVAPVVADPLAKQPSGTVPAAAPVTPVVPVAPATEEPSQTPQQQTQA